MQTKTHGKEDDKFAVVLGALGGIGLPITRALIEAGYHVLGTEFDVNTDLRPAEWGERFTPYHLDLSDAASIETFISFIAAQGPIHIIVNAAGFIDEKEPGLNIHPSIIEKTFEVNAISAARITQALLPHLTEEAKIVHISSTAGLWGNPGFPVYSASKAALNTFCRSIAKHLASTRKSIYALCPGPTNTGLRERIAQDAQKHQDPERIADTVMNIVLGTSPYKNGDILIVRDNKESLHQSLD